MREFVRAQTAILLRRLAYQIARSAKTGDADTIHDLRVAIRRLNRCLQVFSKFYPDNSRKKIRGRLRDLMHAAGAVRDFDIALELIPAAGLQKEGDLSARLVADRRRLNHDLLQEIRRWKSASFSKKWRQQLDLNP